MNFLYVCHFSNGHIKVGRSVDAVSRIALHAERVSCLGVELVEHFIVECLGNVIKAEAALIAVCEMRATKRNKNEWFEGLEYPEICDAAMGFASHVKPDPYKAVAASWKEYLTLLCQSGFTQQQIATAIGCAQSSIANIGGGRTSEPSFRVGFGLLRIGNKAGMMVPSFISDEGCYDRVIGLQTKEAA